MATRSFVGRIDDIQSSRFSARYVHWDGYPTHMGAALVEILARFDGQLPQVLGELTILNYGWSNLKPGITTGDGLSAGMDDGRFKIVEGIGVAYTTAGGQSSPNDWIIGTLTVGLVDTWGTEWGYIFTTDAPETSELIVVRVRSLDDSVELMARIPFAELSETDWGAVERRELKEASVWP